MLSLGLGPIPAALLGVITAVGGGVVRDILAGETPSVFRAGELNALAALAGIVVMLSAQAIGVPSLLAQALGVLVGTSVRFLSVRLGWRGPTPPRRSART